MQKKYFMKKKLILEHIYYLNFFLHISSSYAKILGETNFRTREIPRSGSKAKDGEKKRKKKKRPNDGKNNGQATHGARKHAWRTQAVWAKNQKDCASLTGVFSTF